MSDNNVISADFGREKREVLRTFARLVKLAGEREAEILGDPLPFLRQAAEEIMRLKLEMSKARDSLRFDYNASRDEIPSNVQPIVSIDRGELDRLRRLEEIVRAWDH